jgi:ankyrin repeat protein
VRPLHLAAERGNTALVTALLAADADPNVLDGERRSPLFLALFEQRADAAEALIRSRRTDLRLVTQGSLPRVWAQQTGHEALVALIDERLAR